MTNNIKENNLSIFLLYRKLNFLNFLKTKYVNKQQNGIIIKNKISSNGNFINKIPE